MTLTESARARGLAIGVGSASDTTRSPIPPPPPPPYVFKWTPATDEIGDGSHGFLNAFGCGFVGVKFNWDPTLLPEPFPLDII